MDLYGILGVSEEATEKEIIKAYRKKALKCHPDKNPDNPKAIELFQELSKALEVLTDSSAKAAYDNVLRAKKAAEKRHRQLDDKRKKLKEDLEAREQRADQRKSDDIKKKAQQNLAAEIERLRKEGSRLLEKEQELLTQKVHSGEAVEEDERVTISVSPKIKVRWNSKKDDSAGTYTEDVLHVLFSRYGPIAAVVFSSRKKGSAIIEFETVTAMLAKAEEEVGNVANPLTVTWLSGKPADDFSAQNQAATASVPTFPTAPEVPNVFSRRESCVTSRDYESLVLMKMRQAEERKKLIEQMMKEDEESGK